jgi:predicted secreted Zn-dependent protease
MNKKSLLILSALFCAVQPAQSASLTKTYNYFSVGGSTLDEIEGELSKRGPQLKSSGRRHPGATRMEFTTRVGYGEVKGACQVVQASVTVKARLILPKWRRSRKAEQDVRLIWDTLSSDIKRHEESHVIIAKNHAREMEQALKGLGRQENCQIAAAKVKAISAKLLQKHDRAQVEFDRIEGMNFESRILRLLRYRIERIGDGRLPG